MRNLTHNARVLRQELQRFNEWLFVADGDSFYLLSNEILVESVRGGCVIRYLDATGFRTRQLIEIAFSDRKISLKFAADAVEAESTAKLIPRVQAFDLKLSVEAARLESANKLAVTLSGQFREFRPLRVALNKHNGRFAEIIARKGIGNIAVLSDMSGVVTPEAILSKAFVWQRALAQRTKLRVRAIWIIADQKTAGPLRAMMACLRDDAVANLVLYRPQKSHDNKSSGALAEYSPRTFNSLWSGALHRLSIQNEKTPTRFSLNLLTRFPNVVDCVFFSKGETLRFKGLPFARTRRIRDSEQIWIGTENQRPLFEPGIQSDLEGLLTDLSMYRRHDSPNKQHELYRNAPEAWLESVLRNNIRSIDSNLVLSPVYNQFRTARDKIDLLALRRDGRLIIIELKVTPDREMVFQAVDYWRKIEAQRRRGSIGDLRLFGNRRIADRSTMIYLVGPTLGFHTDLDFLAEKIVEKIEIYRFDLAENWRENISVMNRRRIGPRLG